MPEIVLACSNLCKYFQQGPETLKVIDQLNFEVQAGQSIAIVGNSGCGKTTLLHLLAGLDTPTAGAVRLMGQPLGQLNQKRLSELRNRHLGFVYQFHHLLSEFNAVENVAMPLLIRGVSWHQARGAAQSLLVKVGLRDRASHKPAQLSGGERQRVAIARALVTRPDCLLADEPTGNLDVGTAQEVQSLLLELSRQEGGALVVVTHALTFAQGLGSQLRLKAGRFIVKQELT